MAKHKLTIADKTELRDIIFKNIEKQHPIFDYEKYIEEEKQRIEDYLNCWRLVCWKQSDDVQTFFNTYNLEEEQQYGYKNLNIGHDDIKKEKFFCLKVKTIWSLRSKTPAVMPDLYKDVLINSAYCTAFYDYLNKISNYEAERIELEIQKREKEFMKIYNNFKNILYSCKYLEDVGTMIPLPEIIKYIEGRLLKQCTTLAPINKDSINFVDNYIKSLKND